jgi:hypothetical protein
MNRVRVLRGGRLVDVDRGNDDGDWLGVTLAAIAGAGLGLFAGLAASQFFSEVSPRRVSGAFRTIGRRSPKGEPPSLEALERTVNGALGENPKTRHLDVHARALSEGIVELTGTAPDAGARAAAATVARGAVDHAVIVNRILVAGSDVARRPGRRER